MDWRTLQLRVMEWAGGNFGDNGGLGHWCPLVGMVEEMGEMERAKTGEDYLDGVADCAIYCLDFAGRLGVEVHAVVLPASLPCDDSLPSSIGKAAHAVLKRHQGIRGFDDSAEFRLYVTQCVNKILSALAFLAHQSNHTLLGLAESTFVEVVSKRDWKVNPLSGATQTASNETPLGVAA